MKYDHHIQRTSGYATVHRCNDIIARNYRISEYVADGARNAQLSVRSATSVSVKILRYFEPACARLRQIYRIRLYKRTRIIDATLHSLCRQFISQRACVDLRRGRLSNFPSGRNLRSVCILQSACLKFSSSID